MSLVLGPWLRAFLSLASRGSVLVRAGLGLGPGFFCVLGLGLGLEPVSSTPSLKKMKHAKLGDPMLDNN